MKRRWNRMLAYLLTAGMVLGLTACSDSSDTAAEDTAAEEQTESQAASQEESQTEVVSISLYPANANLTSGTVSGYLGEWFESRGLSVDVWAYSDEKTNAILASGELPDIMYVTAEQLSTLIDSGMILQLDDYLDDIPNVVSHSDVLDPAFNYIRQYRSNDTGSVYAFPTTVGPTAQAEPTDRNVIKLNWEVYSEIGCPEINDYDDYISVMQQMMEACPEDEEGTKVYGTTLNSGSDGTYWGNIILWMRWHSYTEDQLPYLLEADMLNGTYSSILEDNSMYYQGLQFYYKAMQAGVLNPDGINIDRSTAGSLYKMGSGGTQPGWHDTYYEYLIPGTKIYENPNTIYGDATYGNTDCYIVINAKTANLDAVLNMIDILSNPDDYILFSMGPEGDYYEITDDGQLLLTDRAKEWLQTTEDSSKYTYENGEEAYLWNTSTLMTGAIATSYTGYDGGEVPSGHGCWPEELSYTNNTVMYNLWSEDTGYENWSAWLEAEDALVTESVLDGISTFASQPDSTMQLTIDAIKDTVVAASWQMVYAESEEQFESIWQQMVSDCEELGAQDIIDWRLEDLENAKTIRDSLAE